MGVGWKGCKDDSENRCKMAINKCATNVTDDQLKMLFHHAHLLCVGLIASCCFSPFSACSFYILSSNFKTITKLHPAIYAYWKKKFLFVCVFNQNCCSKVGLIHYNCNCLCNSLLHIFVALTPFHIKGIPNFSSYPFWCAFMSCQLHLPFLPPHNQAFHKHSFCSTLQRKSLLKRCPQS